MNRLKDIPKENITTAERKSLDRIIRDMKAGNEVLFSAILERDQKGQRGRKVHNLEVGSSNPPEALFFFNRT